MSFSNPKTLSNPKEGASRRWKPYCSGCYLQSSSQHSCSSTSRRRGCRCTHEQRLESTPRRSAARRGGCRVVLHHGTAHRGRVLLCVLAESNPVSRCTERGVRVHRSAAVVSEATLRSDALAHDPGGFVVFGFLGDLGSVAQKNRRGIVGEGSSVAQTAG